MSVIGSNILAGASGQGGGYNLTKSLRFRSSASAYLNRTPASATNRTTWTYSYWFKGINTTGSVDYWALSAFSDGNNYTAIRHRNLSDIDVLSFNGGSAVSNVKTAALFRDPAAWYHMVIVFDTSNATQADRIQIYQNGVRSAVQSSPTYPSSGSPTGWVNSTAIHYIGRQSTEYFEGYMAEIHLIDGQALTPSSFGQTSTTTGVWIPKKYTGTYGTNGFYLPFTDTTSTSTLGTDFSGNSNTWTVNGISLTSGSTYDSMNDVPTLTSATTANYCVLNPLKSNSSTSTYQNGNLQVTFPNAGAGGIATGTMAVSSGKFYWEVTVGGTDGSTQPKLGIISPTVQTETSSSIDVGDLGYAYVRNGNKSILGTVTAYGSSFTTNDVIGFALDMDAGTLVCYKNNVSQGTLVSGLTGQFTAGLTAYNGYSETINFGQQPFTYTPPTGFVALNTYNLPTPTIGATASSQANDYFNAVTYTGTSGTQAVTGVGFQPDFVWIKARNSTLVHVLQDAVRGTTAYLQSNSTAVENTNTASNWFRSFDSDGFTVATLTSPGGVSTNEWNNTGYNYVGWNWKANGTGVTNTDGSITSTVSANTTAGFSIVAYTGNATSGATVGHGLGVAPSMVILKSRSLTTNWYVYHSGLTSALYQVYLNLTSGQDDTGITALNDKAPTSTVFELPGTGYGSNNSSATYVAYCFAPVAGYSAFGTYTGNGDPNGTFVYLGFRPRFVLYKSSTAASVGDWRIHDTSRSSYNAAQLELYAQSSGNEPTSSNAQADILSNGFKLRGVSGNTSWNESGVTYIYMAFAEVPFKFANAR